MAILSNNEIKSIRSLREKKFRDESGLFVVEGEKLVSEALASSFQVEKVIRKSEVGQAVMERISSLDSPSPVLAVVHQAPADYAFPVREDGLYLALDSIRDPGNLGTILRLADWFGVSGVFLSPDTVDRYNPKVLQSTMGAIFRVKMCVRPIADVCREAASAGARVYGTLLDGEDIYRSSLKPTGVIVMGNESRGLSADVRELVTDRLLIPSFAQGEHAESLNVATATAITLSEFKRRSIK